MATGDPNQELVPADLDTKRRFARVTHERDDGFVEFDFAIGEPELFVEMILTRAAFDEFCAINRVEDFPPEPATPEAVSDFDWRLKDATHTRFK